MSKQKRVNYRLRPAKNIERKMMGEAFARLAVIRPLSQYRYVGFGSEFFNDFALYHQRLGITQMVSIEEDEASIERCKFNRPYRCITIKPGTSQSVLPQLAWNKRSIVWLDYTDRLDSSMLEDARYVLTQATSGSAIIVTVNANADMDDHGASAPEKRLEQLRSRVGKSRVPSGVTGGDLTKWGLAKVSYQILSDEIQTTLNDRNAPLKSKDKLIFSQCFHFQYRDGQQMLTIGGVLLDPKDRRAMGRQPFEGLPFVREGPDPMRIEPPTLTSREVRYLNRRMPRDTAALKELPWLTDDERDQYRQVYRYFPFFSESEL
jgi:hypothetical protein